MRGSNIYCSDLRRKVFLFHQFTHLRTKVELFDNFFRVPATCHLLDLPKIFLLKDAKDEALLLLTVLKLAKGAGP
jgi:hypothetical protein